MATLFVQTRALEEREHVMEEGGGAGLHVLIAGKLAPRNPVEPSRPTWHAAKRPERAVDMNATGLRGGQ